jgi:hypothetical protein
LARKSSKPLKKAKKLESTKALAVSHAFSSGGGAGSGKVLEADLGSAEKFGRP